MSNNMALFLAKNSVFTRQEFYDFWDKDKSLNPRAIDSLLRYHELKGHLKRIKRGLYAALSALETKDKNSIDPYLVTIKLAPDAVLAYHTAIEYHGKGYSTYWYLYYLTETHPRLLKLGQYHYQPLQFPKPLIKSKKCDFEVETTTYRSKPIRVTSLERTLVDALDKLSISGGWEEVWRSFENVSFLKWERVIEYCLLLENATLCAKLGFYLEQRQQELSGLQPAYLRVLEKRKPKSVHYLKRVSREDKFENWHFVKRWNLMVPEVDFTRKWDEINL